MNMKYRDANTKHDGPKQGRVERWHGHIVDAIATYAANGVEIPAAWFEEVEQRPMADVITDWVCRNRGIGCADLDANQQSNFDLDEDYERGNARARDNHERGIAVSAVLSHLSSPFRHDAPSAGVVHDLIRRFYRPGDCGIDAAIVRAIMRAGR